VTGDELLKWPVPDSGSRHTLWN